MCGNALTSNKFYEGIQKFATILEQVLFIIIVDEFSAM